jgi:hypothetical protein
LIAPNALPRCRESDVGCTPEKTTRRGDPVEAVMMGQSFHRRSVCKSLVVDGRRRVVGPAHRICRWAFHPRGARPRRQSPGGQLTVDAPARDAGRRTAGASAAASCSSSARVSCRHTTSAAVVDNHGSRPRSLWGYDVGCPPEKTTRPIGWKLAVSESFTPMSTDRFACDRPADHRSSKDCRPNN